MDAFRKAYVYVRNVFAGVPVSEKAKELSALWVSGSITSDEMKKQLIDYHRKTEY